MQKLAALLLTTLMMAGCAFPGVYKINVQQGNILSEEELTQLEKGMSRQQVQSVLGSPIMLNPVDPTREYYVYTFQRGGGDIKEQRVIVYYENERFSHYEANLLEETPAY
ncbi:outer membrane protein assembly factor BamE [Marinobacter caseinilyticus]|uniref:outer membrane protein assembly factor BamE n=1 Tax=Marinobacter caseinilyticus TaxID=2692195 RepID=UPI00140A245C|nr:outer membrane protein assembly factor BamE [Marinobacter caseinilyticus]